MKRRTADLRRVLLGADRHAQLRVGREGGGERPGVAGAQAPQRDAVAREPSGTGSEGTRRMLRAQRCMVAAPMRRALVLALLAALAGRLRRRRAPGRRRAVGHVQGARSSARRSRRASTSPRPCCCGCACATPTRAQLDNVAVTVRDARAGRRPAPAAFGQRQAPRTSSPPTERPVWVLDKGPTGGDTADASTRGTAGPLCPGEEQDADLAPRGGRRPAPTRSPTASPPA